MTTKKWPFGCLLMIGLLTVSGGCATKFPPEQQLVPGQCVLVTPRLRWNKTGVFIEKGKSYELVARAVRDNQGHGYKDSYIGATPDGVNGWGACLFDGLAREPKSRLNPASWRRERVQRLRVLHDGKQRATFLTLIGSIGKWDESEMDRHAFVIGSALRLDAKESGELYVFSNDWYGDGDLGTSSRTYANNKGLLILQIREAGEVRTVSDPISEASSSR